MSRHCHLAIGQCTIRQRVFDCKYFSCKICFNVLNYVFFRYWYSVHPCLVIELLTSPMHAVKTFDVAYGAESVGLYIAAGSDRRRCMATACLFASVAAAPCDKVVIRLWSHHTMGHFTFWISLSPSPKFGLRPKISQKVKSFFVSSQHFAEWNRWDQTSNWAIAKSKPN